MFWIQVTSFSCQCGTKCSTEVLFKPEQEYTSVQEIKNQLRIKKLCTNAKWNDKNIKQNARQHNHVALLHLLLGTPGLLLSAEPVGLTWAGSSPPPRRTCLHLVSGVWPVQLCCPVFPRRMRKRGEKVLVSSACDGGSACPTVFSSLDL